MDDVWNRVESWLAVNAPKILQGLLPGATEEAIRSTEEHLTVQFPADFRVSCAVHNGQRGTAPSLMGQWDLLPLEAVVKQWNLMKELSDAGRFANADAVVETRGPVRMNWWNTKWIPVTHNGAGDFYCLDMDPASGGVQGQIITYWHVDTTREKIADNFRELLQKFADDLYARKYKVVDTKLEIAD
jgi:cell wall assembly regulator SMI1